METYAELYVYMMPIALEYGISIDEYETRTFRELEYMIAAKKEVHDRNVKSNIMLEYQMVDLMAASLGRIMSKDAKYPEIYDIYPTIFGNELKQSVLEQKEKMENERLALQWRQFAAGHNSSLKSKTEVEE